MWKDFNYESSLESREIFLKKKILREKLKVLHVNNKCTCTNIHRTILVDLGEKSTKHMSTNLPRSKTRNISYIFPP